MSTLERVPPQNLEAEQAVLGSMLIEREAIIKVADTLHREDFYREANREVFQAIVNLHEHGEAVDLVTVTDELRKQGLLETIGGIAYLTALANAVPTAANAEHYARIVEEKALLRELITVATDIVARGYQGAEEVAALVDDSERRIFEIAQRRSTEGYSAIKGVLLDAFERIEFLYSNKEGVTGVPTGFKGLDALTSGLQPSDLIVIAARPSMGKTTLLLNMARNAALTKTMPVAIFSLEMSKEQLAQRLLCAEAGVDGQRLRTGHLADADWPRLSHALGRLSEAPIFIDDTPSISVMELRAKARRIKAEHDLGLIVVDYIQLMRTRGRVENRQQEISEISRSLKALARELRVPVIIGSQLSRAVEQRDDKKPMLSDLRESGAIEQDADLVAFIFREEYYKPDTEKKNIAEIIVAKQRNGPTGTVELVFMKEYGRFADPDKFRKPA
ncbi:MAG: replicative DNA helicase [Bacillota bacterium]